MPLDPNIALGIHPPAQVSPLDQVSKVMSLRNLMQEGQYRQAATERQKALTEDTQDQAQQRSRDLADSNSFQKDLLNTQDWEKTFTNMQGKVAPSNFLKYRESYDKTVEQQAKGNQEQRKADILNYTRLDNALNGIKALDEGDQPVAYSNLLAELGKDKDLAPMIKQGRATGMIPDHFDSKHLDFLHSFVVGQKGIGEEAEKRAQTAKAVQDTAKAGVETANAAAENSGKVADSAAKVAHLPLAQALDKATLTDKNLLTPEQRQQQTDKEKELQYSAGHLAVARGQLALAQAKQSMEMGPGTVQTWVDVLKHNPDAVKEVPAALHSAVATQFNKDTGLPMPTAASQNSVSTELASRNALDNGAFINKAMQNPEIQKRLGPILGRLGTAEQSIGTATAGLSPEAAKLAQELRTRMRYFVFQEGKSVLGGRLPQNLMQQLETSSANVKMDSPTLSGAISGAMGAAKTSLDNIDKERFGGKMRPRVLRGFEPEKTYTNPQTGHKIGTDDGKVFYDMQTGQEVKQ